MSGRKVVRVLAGFCFAIDLAVAIMTGFDTVRIGKMCWELIAVLGYGVELNV